MLRHLCISYHHHYFTQLFTDLIPGYEMEHTLVWAISTSGHLQNLYVEWNCSSCETGWILIFHSSWHIPLFYHIWIIKRAGDGMQILFPFVSHPHHIWSSSRDGLWLLSVSSKTVLQSICVVPNFTWVTDLGWRKAGISLLWIYCFKY
jgi:hypothetical protein